jgi:hypothetical protein
MNIFIHIYRRSEIAILKISISMNPSSERTASWCDEYLHFFPKSLKNIYIETGEIYVYVYIFSHLYIYIHTLKYVYVYICMYILFSKVSNFPKYTNSSFIFIEASARNVYVYVYKYIFMYMYVQICIYYLIMQIEME